jgi:hypothetical protein
MINDPNINDPRRDPLDPRDPASDPAYRDPRVVNQTAVHPGSGRGGLAIAAVLAALLVIGFIAFTGNDEGVDPNPTAATGTTQEVLPGAEPAAPSMDATGDEPAAAPAAPLENNNPAGTGTAPSE